MLRDVSASAVMALPHSQCRLRAEHVVPAGQSPTSPAHTTDRSGAPRCSRSTTRRPNGPAVVSVSVQPGQTAATEAVLGFWPCSTQAVSARTAGISSSTKPQWPPWVVNS